MDIVKPSEHSSKRGMILDIHQIKPKPSYITLILFCIIFFARDIAHIQLPLYTFIIVTIITSLFYSKVDFAIIGACTPLFSSSVQYNYIFAILIVVFFAKSLQKNGKIRINMFFILTLLLAGLELLHFYIKPFDFEEYLRYASSILYLGISISVVTDLKNEEIRQVIKAYIYVYLFVMIDIMLQFIAFYGNLQAIVTMGIRIGNIKRAMGSSGENFITLFSNENNIALYSILAVVLCICMYFQGYKNRFIWFLLAMISAGFGLMTLSKMFLIMMILVVAFLLFEVMTYKKIKLINKILIIILFSSLSFFGVNQFFKGVIDNIQARISSVGFDNGRLTIMADYHDYFSRHVEYWLHGMGVQSQLEKVGVGTHVMHNATQEYVISFGFLGVILLLVACITIIRTVRFHRGKGVFLNCFPILCMFLFVQTIQFISAPNIFLTTIVCVTALLYNYNKEDVLV